MNKINNKIDYISKTKSRSKKTYELKNHCQINPHLACKFGYFWTIFFVAQWLHLWRSITLKLKIGKIWYMIFHSFQHIAHFSCTQRWPLLMGRGVCISLLWTRLKTLEFWVVWCIIYYNMVKSSFAKTSLKIEKFYEFFRTNVEWLPRFVEYFRNNIIS